MNKVVLVLLYVSYGQKFGPMEVAKNLLENFTRENICFFAVVDRATAKYISDRKHIYVAKNYLDMIRALFIIILNFKIKICHFNFFPLFLTPLLLVMKLRNIKIVYSFHGGILLEQRRKLIRSLFIIQCKHFYDVIIANSRYSAKLLLSLGKHLDKKVVIIPNGVEFKEYCRSVTSSLKGSPSVLYVGRLEYIKGIDILVKAIHLVQKKLSNICLHIVGEGQQFREIKKLVHDLGIKQNVIFHGFVTNRRRELYIGSNIVVIPSRRESFGIVALEAMAAGKPLIVSNKGALPELVKHNYNGLIVELTPQALAEAILDLNKDKNLIVRMSENNKKIAKFYDWKRISRKYVNLYKVLIRETVHKLPGG